MGVCFLRLAMGSQGPGELRSQALCLPRRVIERLQGKLADLKIACVGSPRRGPRGGSGEIGHSAASASAPRVSLVGGWRGLGVHGAVVLGTACGFGPSA